MFLTLWNVYRFHADYAALDGFDPDEDSGFVPVSERSPLDRWILSKVTKMADDYHSNFASWDSTRQEEG